MGKEFFIFYGGLVLYIPTGDTRCSALFCFPERDKLPKTRRNIFAWLCGGLLPSSTVDNIVFYPLVTHRPQTLSPGKRISGHPSRP